MMASAGMGPMEPTWHGVCGSVSCVDRLRGIFQGEFGVTQDRLAEAGGDARDTVSGAVRPPPLSQRWPLCCT